MADALEKMLEVSLSEVRDIHNAKLTGWHSGYGLLAHIQIAVRMQFAETITCTKDILQTSLEDGGVGFEEEKEPLPIPPLKGRETCCTVFYLKRVCSSLPFREGMGVG